MRWMSRRKLGKSRKPVVDEFAAARLSFWGAAVCYDASITRVVFVHAINLPKLRKAIMELLTFKAISFVVISAVILYISRRSLRVVKSHGFYRFFALEAILVLILLNIRFWFTSPFSTLQILSWACLAVSLLFVGQGAYLILAAGKPSGQRHDTTLMAFEKTTIVVTSGIYRYIRHPLYSSLLFLAWGAFLKNTSLLSTSLVVTATIFLVATAKADEAECMQFFGSEYKDYMTQTKMFVPLLF